MVGGGKVLHAATFSQHVASARAIVRRLPFVLSAQLPIEIVY